MAKYLVLYKAGGSGPENMDDPTPDEHRAWLEWRDTVGDALVDFGSATIAVPGSGGGDVGGYSIVQADTLDALDAVFDANPHRKRGGIIEFHEILDMPDA